MGSCCCGPSDKGEKTKYTPLKKNSNLWIAQQMKTTPSGHKVCQRVTKKIMTQREAERILIAPDTPEDFKTIFGPPFNSCNKLKDFLYLTGLGGLTKENIEELGINLIINATYEWPSIQVDGITTIKVPVDDGEKDDISIYFDEVSEKIEECHLKNGRALVHCMAGASRSTTLVLAYLIKYQNINLRNAFNSVKKRRETARPNIGFWDQLIRYEIRVRGVSSVRLIYVSDSGITVQVPDFYQKEHPSLYRTEIEKQVKMKKVKLNDPGIKSKSQKQFNDNSLTYE